MPIGPKNMPAPVNPPRKHHYLPEFYTRPWTGDDRCLERFIKLPDGTMHARRVAPRGIGWEMDLYAAPGLAPTAHNAHQLETAVFAPLDSAAAKVRDALLAGREIRTSEERSAWAAFLLSLFHRSPTHLAATKEKLAEIYNRSVPSIQRKYAQLKAADDPEMFEDWVQARDPMMPDRAAHRLVASTVDNQRVGEFIVRMKWIVIDLQAADRTLLISDNPVVFRPLKLPGGHMALPISPTSVFVGSADRCLFEYLARQSPNQLVRDCNRVVVGNAYHFVAASDRGQRDFIEKRFGQDQLGSLATGFRSPR